jgi:hypothetical protein
MARHAARNRPCRANLYQEITTKIIAELEAGRVPWVQPWGTAAAKAPLAMPKNASTGRFYSGVNVLILWGSVIEHGFPVQGWLTFRQAFGLGGNVRKGEHGTTVVYADRFIPDDEKKRARETGEEAQAIPFLKRFTVFNLAQCEGLPGDLVVAAPPPKPGLIEPKVEALIKATGIDFRIGGRRAAASVGNTELIPALWATVECNPYRALSVLDRVGDKLADDESGRGIGVECAFETLLGAKPLGLVLDDQDQIIRHIGIVGDNQAADRVNPSLLRIPRRAYFDDHVAEAFSCDDALNRIAAALDRSVVAVAQPKALPILADGRAKRLDGPHAVHGKSGVVRPEDLLVGSDQHHAVRQADNDLLELAIIAAGFLQSVFHCFLCRVLLLPRPRAQCQKPGHLLPSSRARFFCGAKNLADSSAGAAQTDSEFIPAALVGLLLDGKTPVSDPCAVKLSTKRQGARR